VEWQPGHYELFRSFFWSFLLISDHFCSIQAVFGHFLPFPERSHKSHSETLNCEFSELGLSASKKESCSDCRMAAHSQWPIQIVFLIVSGHLRSFLPLSKHFWRFLAGLGNIPQVTFWTTKMQILRARRVVIQKLKVLRLRNGSPVTMSYPDRFPDRFC
jgi:hypothetical protein